MAVFSGTPQIKSQHGSRPSDCALPPSGALAWGTISTLSGLTKTNGCDVKLVHGDRHEEVIGSVKTRIAKNYSTQVQQDANHAVGGDRRDKITGNAQYSVIGSQTTYHNGPLSATYLSAQTEVRQEDLQRQHTHSYLQSVRDHFLHCNTDHATHMYNIEVALSTFGIYTTKAEFGIMSAGAAILELDDKKTKIALRRFETKLTPIASKIKAQVVGLRKVFNAGSIMSVPPSFN